MICIVIGNVPGNSGFQRIKYIVETLINLLFNNSQHATFRWFRPVYKDGHTYCVIWSCRLAVIQSWSIIVKCSATESRETSTEFIAYKVYSGFDKCFQDLTLTSWIQRKSLLKELFDMTCSYILTTLKTITDVNSPMQCIANWAVWQLW